MKEALYAVHGVMGVEGAVLVDAEGKLLLSTLPQPHTSEIAAKIGYGFSLGIKTMADTGYTPRAIYGTFEQGRVIVRPFSAGIVIVLGAPHLKPLLLREALNQTIARLEEGSPDRPEP